MIDYDPDYARAWLHVLSSLGVIHDATMDDRGRLIIRATGEIIADNPDAHELADLLLTKLACETPNRWPDVTCEHCPIHLLKSA